MARMRTVKPEFFRSATIGKLKRDTRLLFIGMWTEADDAGRGLAEPRHLAGSLFPFDRDMTERKIRSALHELAGVVCADGKRGLIILYEASGTSYYAIRSWWHQNVNRRGDPRYPAPPSGTLFTDDSLNSTTQNTGPPSVKGTRQGSGSRFQGSGSDLGLRATESESVTPVPAPTTDPTADGTPEDPKARAVALLERNGNTHDGAVELVDAIGPDAVLAKFEHAS